MKIRNIILYFIGSLAICSCDDMFEPAIENNRTLDVIPKESKYAHGLLMYGYDRLPYITTTQSDVATDDATTNMVNGKAIDAYYYIATGAWSSDSNPLSMWDGCKDGIQHVNLFLTMVDEVEWAPSAVSKQQMFIDRLKGEAFGLRALFYYYLLQAHGGYADDNVLYGVPLLTLPEDVSSDFNQPRATFAACVKQVFADCDSAMALLPFDYADVKTTDGIPAKYLSLGAQVTGFNLVFGDASRGLMSAKIAEAIKAQTALLAASPAFREQSGVTSAEAAALCANVLKRIGGLDGFDMTGSTWYKNKNKLKPEAAEMPEILWRESRSKDSNQEERNFPPSMFGLGRVNPSQNLVDAFPMRSGRPITDPNSGYDPQNPYANRDPRLDDDIVYNGMQFGAAGNIVITGNYSDPNPDPDKDKNNGTIDNLNQDNATRTGYYMKKLLRNDVSTTNGFSRQDHIYPRIRYTEIFLAYAEAANDAWGPKADPTGIGFTAYDVIKKIRERAGLATDFMGLPLPEGDAYLEECANNQAKMTDLIRNERRIELCFENKRFWDLRRWLLPIDETVNGISIDLNAKTGELTYTVFPVDERKFDSSFQYYGPIPKSEVLKWSNLKQNKGWQLH